MPTKRVKVAKSDHLRPLVTEVLPAEVPIIFSNDGLYLRALRNQATHSGLPELIFNALISQEEDFTKKRYIPYTYKIRKSALTYRNLSVVHPGAQWQAKNFYQHFSSLMLHYTKRSRISIRYPSDYAKVFFIKGPVSDLGKFKRAPVAERNLDIYLRHSPSYFSYDGYTRLYKFFDSTEFVELERDFSCLWMIDVSKCFDSIYTHSISWALKDKPFAKDATGFVSFGEYFDAVMRSMNYAETSGIVIGPEFSRIFAEIILQRADCAVIRRLEDENGLVFGSDYQIRRYVDDYFIFTRSHEVAGAVFKAVEIELSHLKLGLNEAKTKRLVRPFLTQKSKVILEVSDRLNRFTRKIAIEKTDKELKYLEPREVFNIERLALSFCNDVKLCCTDNQCEYDEVSGYLISGLKNRAALMMAAPPEEVGLRAAFYKDALSVIVRVMFFLYSVAPSVAASYRLCAAVLMITRFAEKNMGDFSASMKELVFSQAVSVFENGIRQDRVEGFVDLELQNLLLAIGDLGDDYRISPDVINRMFCDVKNSETYFNFATVLFYIKASDDYSVARHWVLSGIENLIGDLEDVTLNSERAMCVLDFIACPYIERARRESWLRRLLRAIDLPTPSPAEAEELLKDFLEIPWFINWSEIDLLNLLERKELHAVY